MQVVITGLGMTTALGDSVSTSWEALLRGETGIRAMTRCMALPGDANAAGEIDITLSPYQDRLEAFAVQAGHEALAHAGMLDVGKTSRRLGIVLGCSLLGIESLVELARHHRNNPSRVPPWLSPAIMSNGPASRLARDYSATGPVLTINTACASGLDAIGLGALLLRSGQADVVLAGGVDAQIVPWMLSATHSLRTMAKDTHSPSESLRPWDAARTGMVIGEGAACVVLEREDDVGKHGIISMCGYHSACHPISYVTPDKTSVARCLADVQTPYIGGVYGLSVHGSGTLLGDATEMAAISDVFGNECARMTAWATKGAFGHTFAAGGAIDVVIASKVLQTGWIPPTRNLDVLDEKAPPLQFTKRSLYRPLRQVTILAMGFGGHHAAMRLGVCSG